MNQVSVETKTLNPALLLRNLASHGSTFCPLCRPWTYCLTQPVHLRTFILLIVPGLHVAMRHCNVAWLLCFRALLHCLCSMSFSVGREMLDTTLPRHTARLYPCGHDAIFGVLLIPVQRSSIRCMLYLSCVCVTEHWVYGSFFFLCGVSLGYIAMDRWEVIGEIVSTDVEIHTLWHQFSVSYFRHGVIFSAKNQHRNWHFYANLTTP